MASRWPIGPSGTVSMALAPNEGASPAGTFYKITCNGNDRVTGIGSTEALTCSTATGYTLTLMNVGANASNNGAGYHFGGDVIDTNNTGFDAGKIQGAEGRDDQAHLCSAERSRRKPRFGGDRKHSVCITSATSCFGAAATAYNAGTTSAS